ncbi:AraC family transcriptional regulator [Phytohabitans rumicis]|uniref:AraC family transcriptional regulator n=1 Tax=Phytohabitans rumicis TaxID=1076125 RepID=A0A6V8KQG6_9ACTN|nr:AraC family transcriptional regulator [Phytohabitans rumicis]GFJ87423.1 AraC family transcriptional regulator [Phytohabitans rumicis]
MDLLSDTLSAMRTGQPYAGRTTCQAPWGVLFPDGDAAACHVVLQGSCWLIPQRGAPLALGVGDVVFTPHGDAHAIVDQPGSPTMEYQPQRGDESPIRQMTIPGPGATTEMLCASYSFDRVRPHPLLHGLPPVVHLPTRVGQHPALRAAVDLLGNELREPRAGTEAVLPALIDMLLLYVLRAWLEEQSGHGATGWATALHDPAISVALHRVHRHPERPWTVEDLAKEAGLSRAAFAKRFAAVVGQPPLTYLTWWRMTTAARLLRQSDVALSTIAERCGYGSEFAFAKAFKREFGTAPGRYRRTPLG